MTTALARKAMIDSQLRPEGVNDRAILAAFAAVEREDFVPGDKKTLAYRDRAIDLPDGGAMIPAAALGKMLMRAAPVAGETALVTGPGADYAAAVLAALGVDAKTSGKGKFDLILIGGAIEELPDMMMGQLASGGRIITGLCDRGVTRLAEGRKIGKSVAFTSFADAQMPVLADYRRVPAFAF